MLDKVTAHILGIVNEQCKDNNYIVMKDADIIPYLGKKNKMTNDGIKEAINYLAEREYLKLKYSEEGTYCLTVLPKGRLFDETAKEDKYHLTEEKLRNVKFLLQISFLSALFSFLGAAGAVFIMYYFLLR